MGYRRHRLAVVAVVVVLVVAATAGFAMFRRVESGVERRRAQNQATISGQARQHHDAEIRLCEVAINVQNSNLRALIDGLTKVAVAPRDAAETQARAQSQAVVNQFLAPIDCETFVATGRLTPKTAP